MSDQTDDVPPCPPGVSGCWGTDGQWHMADGSVPKDWRGSDDGEPGSYTEAQAWATLAATVPPGTDIPDAAARALVAAVNADRATRPVEPIRRLGISYRAPDAPGASEWPLRGRDGHSARSFLDELARYVQDPDLISPADVGWAYDTILELWGMVHGLKVATQLLRDEPRPASSPSFAIPAGRWRTGQSVDPRVTLYRDNVIAGLLLTERLADEVVALCNAATTGEPQLLITEETTTTTERVCEADLSPDSLTVLRSLAESALGHDTFTPEADAVETALEELVALQVALDATEG